MADTFALPHLFDAVVAQFAADELDCANHFGWRTPAQQRSGARILWVPGDTAGSMGQITAPKRPGLPTRQLGTLEELFTCYFVTANTATPEDERAQYQAIRELFDAWFRAVYLASHGTFGMQAPVWLLDKKERRHGAGLYVVGMIQAPIFDEDHGEAPTDTAADVDVEELDVTEQFTVTKDG